jgi:hypothetical protein
MKDKIKLNIRGGGIFSKMMLAIQNIATFDYGIENCYLNIADNRALGLNDSNPLDSILNQTSTEEFVYVECKPLAPYSVHNRIEDDTDYLKLRYIVSQLRYKQELKVLIEDFVYMLGIDKDTIGVHLRLCDMNIQHGTDYGYFTFDNYVDKIKQELEYNTKVFIASDNNESIKKLQVLFGNRILYLPGLIRAEIEAENSTKLQIQNFREVRFWREAFTEMLLLSKCSKLICRTSNLANMSVITSNTIQKIIML